MFIKCLDTCFSSLKVMFLASLNWIEIPPVIISLWGYSDKTREKMPLHDIWGIRYLLVCNRLPPNLAAQSNKHVIISQFLWVRNLAGLISWVVLGQGLSWGQDLTSCWLGLQFLWVRNLRGLISWMVLGQGLLWGQGLTTCWLGLQSSGVRWSASQLTCVVAGGYTSLLGIV